MNKAVATQIDSQAAWFERNMLVITRQVRNRLNTMLNAFDRDGGTLLNTPANIQRMSQIYNSIIAELNTAGYANLVTELNKRENDLLKALRDNPIKGAVPLAFTETSREALAAFNGLWNLKFGGLADQTARDIAGIVGKSIFGTQSVDSTIKDVSEILEAKFTRYATTYVNTSRAEFIQAAEYESAKNYDGKLYWYYEGPEDDVTRPICRVGTGMDADATFPNAPLYTEEERISFEAMSSGERQYNCRHSFMQVSEEYYIENTGGA